MGRRLALPLLEEQQVEADQQVEQQEDGSPGAGPGRQGGGIAAENVDRIFTPFFTTKPPAEGTGLGLCIVHRVVSDAHGQLRVESDFGRGTTFFVTLPRSSWMAIPQPVWPSSYYRQAKQTLISSDAFWVSGISLTLTGRWY